MQDAIDRAGGGKGAKGDIGVDPNTHSVFFLLAHTQDAEGE